MNEVIHDWDEEIYYIKEKINDQIFLLSFQENYHSTSKTLYYNVWLSISSKRNQRGRNEELKLSTGKYIFTSVLWAREAFNKIEKQILKENLSNYNIVIYCWWVDNRRRDAYYKVLSRKGYTYQYLRPDLCSKKVIAKRWKQNTNA